MTKLEQRIKQDMEICDRATAGPWFWDSNVDCIRQGEGEAEQKHRFCKQVHLEYWSSPLNAEGPCASQIQNQKNDLPFIAAARTSWPQYIEALSKALKAIEQIQAMAGHPDAAGGCRLIIQKGNFVKEEISKLLGVEK